MNIEKRKDFSRRMWKPFAKKEPEMSIYEKRIRCLTRMLDNQRIMQNTDNEYINVSLIEGKTHENALHRLEIYQKEYNILYDTCKNILK